MGQDAGLRLDGVEGQGSTLGEAVTRNGIDDGAARRAHMRELTMARQSAERCGARPAGQSNLDRSGQLAAARERATVLHEELARIDAVHRTWLEDHGEQVPDARARQAKAAPAPRPADPAAAGPSASE